MSPLGSDGLLVGGEKVEGVPVLSRAQRRRQVSSVGDVSPVEDFTLSPAVSPGVEDGVIVESSVSGNSSVEDEDDEDFDIMSLPAPLADPESYGRDLSGVEDTQEDSSAVEEEDSSAKEKIDGDGSSEALVGWDIIFPEGENPRMLVRAALLTDDREESFNGDSVPVVESSVELSAEDVDKLLKLAHKVEGYHSRSSRMGRRVLQWVMRRKFFAGVTFVILMYLGISEAVRAFI